MLEVDPRNQEALVTLLLAITDQLPERLGEGARQAQELLPKLDDEYKRRYYAGIICERCAKAHLRRGAMGSGEVAYHWFVQAMEWYEKAEANRPPGNDEAILRWNTCARILSRDEHIRPRLEEPATPGIGVGHAGTTVSSWRDAEADTTVGTRKGADHRPLLVPGGRSLSCRSSRTKDEEPRRLRVCLRHVLPVLVVP